MCVCVLEILVLKIFWIDRFFWEIFVLIGSLVELYVGLHSYLCFSHLKKLFWKAGSTPPRHLLDTFLSVKLLKHSFKRNLDTSSIPGGSIEKAPTSSIAPRHLLDRSSFCSESDSLLLDSFLNTSAIEDQILDTYLDRYLDTSRYLHLSRFTSCLYKASVRSGIHFSSISLSILLCFSPKTLTSYSKTSSSRILQDFSSFSLLGKLLILSHSCISWFKT